MNKTELIQRVASVMRENNIRKPVSSQKKVFHISDDDGNVSDFVIKKSNKGVLFTVDDVSAVMDTCIAVIEDAIRRGEHVSVRGFGPLGVHYRKARTTKHPETGEIVEVSERYIPKFIFGSDLRMCAKMFELSLGEGGSYSNALIPDDEEEGGDDYGD